MAAQKRTSGGKSGAPRGTSRGSAARSSTTRGATGGGTPARGAKAGGAKSRSSAAKPARGGQRLPDSRGAGRTGATKQAGPVKPGRGAGRGAGRGTERDDDLGGGQVEGRQAVRELLIAGRRRAYEIWIAGDVDQSDVIDDIRELARASRVPVVEVGRKKLEYTARSEAPQGVLAHAAPVPAVPIEEILKRRPGRVPFLVAVDGVTDPGNLGALLRCCEGAGVNGVVLPRHRSVHITPTVTKTSVGAVEYMPIAVVGGLPATLARMRELGIWVVGLDDAADKSLFEIGDLASEAICLVLGAEGTGLSRLVRERCDLIVSIPMKGRLSSLNVSAAAALATYEVTRHRQ